MFSITISDDGGSTRDILIEADQALIGKSAQACVRLSGWRVGREHARIVRRANGLLIEDLGQILGTWVNGSRIVRHGPLGFADEIVIGCYRLRVRDQQTSTLVQASPADRAPASLMVPKGIFTRPSSDMTRAAANVPDVSEASHAPLATDRPESANPAAHGLGTPGFAPAIASHNFTWRKRIHERLLETIDLRRRDLNRMSDGELRDETATLIREIIAAEGSLPPHLDHEQLCHEVLDEAIGLGPLEALLADDSVSEIMVNRHDEIFVERGGRITHHPAAFSSDRAVLGVIERIVAPIGRRIDESSPMVDARLKDGSRVNAVIPPLALKGPTLTIRKFARRQLDIEDMIGFGSLSAAMADFLRVCVEQRRNIVVSGGTGSGKTTFLNLLSNFIPDGERIITIEDAAELRLNHSHFVTLEARPSNLEGRGAISIRELVRNALRMRPDRIVIGECRGGEALDMLQAMNTGHEGSLTTLHANSPRDALSRLETLVLMAGMELPLAAIREQIASAIDIVVQQTRFSCGARRITSIAEVTGMEAGRIQLQELFRFVRQASGQGHGTGQFSGCDVVPSFYDELRETGVALDMRIFDRQST
ncbi:MAG TPA: ATPase, T2SS/T4P/T4SS family [Thauera sp.]|nr:ATPase, T2SS/T4P/T4SS family [Thauera sp.]